MIKYKERWLDGTTAALFLCMSAWMINWEPLNTAWASKINVVPLEFSAALKSELSKPFLTYLIEPVAISTPIQPLALPAVQQSVIDSHVLQESTVLDVASGVLRLNEKAMLLQWIQNTVGLQIKNTLKINLPQADTAPHQSSSQSYMFGSQASTRTALPIEATDLATTVDEDVLKRREFLDQKNSHQASIFSKELFSLLKQINASESNKQTNLMQAQSVIEATEQASATTNIAALKENSKRTEKKKILHDENIDNIKGLLNSQQLPLAVSQLKTYVDQYPTVLGYRVLLGEIYLNNKQYTLLKNLIMNSLPEQEKPRELVELLARSYIEQRNFDEALALLNQYEEDIAQAPTTHGLIANIYQRMQAYDKAESIYWQLVQYFPNYGKWWLGLGISLEGQRRSKDALGAYEKALNDERLPLGLKNYAKERVDYLKQKMKQET